MTITWPSSFLDAVRVLAPQIQASVEDSEQTRRLPLPLVEAMAQAGLFRLWIPRTLGGEEVDPTTFVRVVEAVAQVDGTTGWCLMIGGGYGIFGGSLPATAAREIYGSDPHIITGGAFRPLGQAVVVEGGYRVTGRWPFGSGCQHCAWLVGGCRIFDGDQPRLQADGTPVTRLLFFPAAACEILDTWYTAGLRGTGSHDYAVAEQFVPAAYALSFREPPVQPGPLYALPTLALLTTGGQQECLPFATSALPACDGTGRHWVGRGPAALWPCLPLRDAQRGMAGGHRWGSAHRHAARHAVAGGNTGHNRRDAGGRLNVQGRGLGLDLYQQPPGALRP
jgi:alkylation response protein AidB-like acyl-CoA dehydrogenase